MIDTSAAPAIAAAAVEFPSQRHQQDEVVAALAEFAGPEFLRFAAASGVQTRHLALPIERYTQLSGFTEANQAYLEVALEIGDAERRIVEAMSSKLVADGMFFVGIDVIGDKVVEINAESPGGMQSVERLYGIDVGPTVIEALARRTTSTS